MPSASTRPKYPELAAHIARTGQGLVGVANKVDVTSQHISHVIKGHSKPSSVLRARLAEVLGVPENELFEEAS